MKSEKNGGREREETWGGRRKRKMKQRERERERREGERRRVPWGKE